MDQKFVIVLHVIEAMYHQLNISYNLPSNLDLMIDIYLLNNINIKNFN